MTSIKPKPLDLRPRSQWLWDSMKTAARLTVAGRWSTIWYGLRMEMRGFDLRRVHVEDLGLNPERANAHASSGGPDLFRVLQAIKIPSGSRIIDFGSGKGGAALTMAEFPFGQIVGIELSQDMIAIAQANCERAGIRFAQFIQADAAEYKDLDRFEYVYLFHPFPWNVLEAVCANLAASLARRNRRLTLIYKNPIFHQELLATGLFKPDRDFKFDPATYDWNLFRIYIHEAGGAAKANA